MCRPEQIEEVTLSSSFPLFPPPPQTTTISIPLPPTLSAAATPLLYCVVPLFPPSPSLPPDCGGGGSGFHLPFYAKGEAFASYTSLSPSLSRVCVCALNPPTPFFASLANTPLSLFDPALTPAKILRTIPGKWEGNFGDAFRLYHDLPQLRPLPVLHNVLPGIATAPKSWGIWVVAIFF